MSRTVKIFFPIGIFLVLFLLFFSSSCGLSGFYYYKYTLNFIDKMTKDANDSSVALVEACSIIAELSDGKEQEKRLNDFFANNPQKKFFSKAFYAKGNGTIIAHSNPEEIKELNGNIAFDEFKYNIDQIFYPLSQNDKKVYLSDYYILDEQIPFTKEEIKYLKQYLYNNIDRNGWLANKTVEKNIKISKKKYELQKTGTINFILSKKLLYVELFKVKEKIIQTAVISAGTSGILSLFLSLIIFLRYNSIRRKTLKSSALIQQAAIGLAPENIEIDMHEEELMDSDNIDIETDSMYPEIFDEESGEKLDINPQEYLKISKYSEIGSNGDVSIDNSYKKPKPPIQIVYDESTSNSENDIVILDAVPIRKRRIS